MDDFREFYKKIQSKDTDNNIQILCELSKKTVLDEGQFIFAGNGGSMAISLHIAAEMTGRFKKDRRSIPAYVLGSNISSLTSIANDYDYALVFQRELKPILRQKDMIILMSTSGKSPNILKCLDLATELNHQNTVLLTGNTDRKFSRNIKVIKTPSLTTARIQEYHFLLLHEMCAYVDTLFNDKQ